MSEHVLDTLTEALHQSLHFDECECPPDVGCAVRNDAETTARVISPTVRMMLAAVREHGRNGSGLRDGLRDLCAVLDTTDSIPHVPGNGPCGVCDVAQQLRRLLDQPEAERRCSTCGRPIQLRGGGAFSQVWTHIENGTGQCRPGLSEQEKDGRLIHCQMHEGCFCTCGGDGGRTTTRQEDVMGEIQTVAAEALQDLAAKTVYYSSGEQIPHDRAGRIADAVLARVTPHIAARIRAETLREAEAAIDATVVPGERWDSYHDGFADGLDRAGTLLRRLAPSHTPPPSPRPSP